jgi:RpiR family carbohydrate utilization transcriptional regulator
MTTDGRRLPVSVLPPDLMRRLSPRRRELIRPVLEHPRDYVLLSARKLADVLASDAMTVLRTIRAMGFDGYPEFRRYLHELALVHTTQIDPMLGGPTRESDVKGLLRNCLVKDATNVATLRHTLDFARIRTVARRLYEARRIVLIGGDLAAVLVHFLRYNLLVIDLPAIACTTPGEVAHVVRSLQRSDLVMAISFRRGLRQTVEGLQQARARGAYCVGLTDTHLSPLARFANEYFVTPVETSVYGVSYVAPIAFLNLLLVACAATRRGRTIRLLKEAEVEQRTGFRWYTEPGRAAPATPGAARRRRGGRPPA